MFGGREGFGVDVGKDYVEQLVVTEVETIQSFVVISGEDLMGRAQQYTKSVNEVCVSP